ncbi:hypothetical protein M513_10801 [Trichuris suis]|uniref:Uncharacterized protein n=1 Tax=Trichuris suis TaxID=68888 RepID=A0A085LTL3_9BILA|nr:hypothetical protein M513_10801 [Trichuris suis]
MNGRNTESHNTDSGIPNGRNTESLNVEWSKYWKPKYRMVELKVQYITVVGFPKESILIERFITDPSFCKEKRLLFPLNDEMDDCNRSFRNSTGSVVSDKACLCLIADRRNQLSSESYDYYHPTNLCALFAIDIRVIANKESLFDPSQGQLLRSSWMYCPDLLEPFHGMPVPVGHLRVAAEPVKYSVARFPYVGGVASTFDLINDPKSSVKRDRDLVTP